MFDSRQLRLRVLYEHYGTATASVIILREDRKNSFTVTLHECQWTGDTQSVCLATFLPIFHSCGPFTVLEYIAPIHVTYDTHVAYILHDIKYTLNCSAIFISRSYSISFFCTRTDIFSHEPRIVI